MNRSHKSLHAKYKLKINTDFLGIDTASQKKVSQYPSISIFSCTPIINNKLLTSFCSAEASHHLWGSFDESES